MKKYLKYLLLNYFLNIYFNEAVTPVMEGIVDLYYRIIILIIIIFCIIMWFLFYILFSAYWLWLYKKYTYYYLTINENPEYIIAERTNLFWMCNPPQYNYYNVFKNFYLSEVYDRTSIVSEFLITRKINSNVLLELLWTIVPIIIIIVMAIPSFILLYDIDEVMNSNITVKVLGYQWYWNYEYSNNEFVVGYDYLNDILNYTQSCTYKNVKYDSVIINEMDLNLGHYRLLDVTKSLVLPIDTHIRVLVTAMDVIHSWAVPSLGVKIDAIPGRLNQIGLYINHLGVLYGQCSELCGVNHGFMPIKVEAIDISLFLKECLNYKIKFFENSGISDIIIGIFFLKKNFNFDNLKMYNILKNKFNLFMINVKNFIITICDFLLKLIKFFFIEIVGIFIFFIKFGILLVIVLFLKFLFEICCLQGLGLNYINYFFVFNSSEVNSLIFNIINAFYLFLNLKIEYVEFNNFIYWFIFLFIFMVDKLIYVALINMFCVAYIVILIFLIFVKLFKLVSFFSYCPFLLNLITVIDICVEQLKILIELCIIKEFQIHFDVLLIINNNYFLFFNRVVPCFILNFDYSIIYLCLSVFFYIKIFKFLRQPDRHMIIARYWFIFSVFVYFVFVFLNIFGTYELIFGKIIDLTYEEMLEVIFLKSIVMPILDYFNIFLYLFVKFIQLIFYIMVLYTDINTIGFELINLVKIFVDLDHPIVYIIIVYFIVKIINKCL